MPEACTFQFDAFVVFCAGEAGKKCGGAKTTKKKRGVDIVAPTDRVHLNNFVEANVERTFVVVMAVVSASAESSVPLRNVLK